MNRNTGKEAHRGSKLKKGIYLFTPRFGTENPSESDLLGSTFALFSIQAMSAGAALRATAYKTNIFFVPRAVFC